jgi:RNA polymerase sigma-B factor
VSRLAGGGLSPVSNTDVVDVRPNDPAAVERVEDWFRTYAATRDHQVRERIIVAYLGLADRLAERYRGSRGVTPEDLCQIARVGLVAAVDRYDPGRTNPFVPYAIASIVGELKRHLRDTTWRLHVARPLKDRALALCRALDELPQRIGRSPTVAELAEHLSATEEDVIEALEVARTRSAASLDQPVGDEGGVMLGDLLPAPGPAEEPEDLLLLPDLVDGLPEPERSVIRMRYFQDLTQDEIAVRVGCSQMQVSRLLRRALERLRRDLVVT